MPAVASETRADQIATLSRMVHELQTDEELGQLLEDLNKTIDDWEEDSDETPSFPKSSRSDINEYWQ